MNNDRLFGIQDAEHLHFDIADVYETDIEPWRQEGDHDEWLIEEWTVRPPTYHLPAVGRLLEWACEWVGEDGEVDEDGSESFDNAAKSPDVEAAFQAAIDLWASKVTYRMADTRVDEHYISWAHDGQPLIDGEPLYRRIDL